MNKKFSIDYLVPLWLTSSPVMQETQVPLGLDEEPESHLHSGQVPSVTTGVCGVVFFFFLGKMFLLPFLL